MTDPTTDPSTDVKNLDYQTDQFLVRRYVSRILTRFFRYRDDARWSDLRGTDVFGSPLLGLPGEYGRRYQSLCGLEREDVPQLRQAIRKLAEEHGHTPCPEGNLQKNLRALAQEMKLPDAVLEVLTFVEFCNGLREFF